MKTWVSAALVSLAAVSSPAGCASLECCGVEVPRILWTRDDARWFAWSAVETEGPLPGLRVFRLPVRSSGGGDVDFGGPTYLRCATEVRTDGRDVPEWDGFVEVEPTGVTLEREGVTWTQFRR